MKFIIFSFFLICTSIASVANTSDDLYQRALAYLDSSGPLISLEHFNRSYDLKPMFHIPYLHGGSILGRVAGFDQSIFEIEFRDSTLSGSIVLDDTHQAFDILQLPLDTIALVEVPYLKHNCQEMHEHGNAFEEDHEHGQGGAPTYYIPSAPAHLFELESKPDANSVIYIDSDGHYLNSPWWVTRYGVQDLPSADISNDEYYGVYLTLKEDYAALDLNITTSQDIFDSYPIGRKARVIITNETFTASSTGWSPIGGFDNGYPSICFRNGFTWGEIGFKLGEVCSHEVGHNLGLRHDGNATTDYYRGHGDGSNSSKLWGPLMGSTYETDVSHFSKGDYINANELQDDYEIMTSINFGIGYDADDHGDKLVSSTSIQFEDNGDFLGEVNSGIITTQTDVDVFKFYTEGGLASITVATAAYKPNLAPQLDLLNSSGAVLESSDPNSTQDAFIQLVLPKGNYYLRIDGVGYLNPITGYTDYGSRGFYRIYGNIPQETGPSSEAVSSQDQISSFEVLSSVDLSTTDELENFQSYSILALNWRASAHGLELSGLTEAVTINVYTPLGDFVDSLHFLESEYQRWSHSLNPGAYILEIQSLHGSKFEKFNLR